jgi:two-component system, response regulator YesN
MRELPLYTILIVEDEEVFRRVLPLIIDWSSLGFSIAGTVENGRKALEFCEGRSVDVVLTDIRMPILNGIELAMELRLRSSGTKVVLLSAFDDFEYARKGIECGVYGYILKSEGEEEIERYFAGLRRRLDEEGAAPPGSGNLDSGRERSLASLIEAAEAPNAAEEGTAPLALALVDLDEWPMLERQLGPQAVHELRDLVRLELVELVEKAGLGSVADHGRSVAVVLSARVEAPNLFFSTLLGEVNSRLAIADLNHRETTSVSLSFAAVEGGRAGLGTALERASAGLAERVSKGPRSCVETPVRSSRGLESFPSETTLVGELRAVLDGLRTSRPPTREGEATAIIEFLDGVEARAVDCRLQLIRPVADFASRAVVVLTRESESPLAESPSAVAVLDSILAEIPLYETASPLLGRLKHAVSDAFGALDSGLDPRGIRLVREAIECMQAAYQGSISLESVAARLKVHPVHLSRVFSRDYGKTFTSVLTGIRIEAAKELLADGRYKIYEIADLVGFGKPRYFSELFKKMTGYTPLEYRGKFT